MNVERIAVSPDAAAWLADKLSNKPAHAPPVPVLVLSYGMRAFDSDWEPILRVSEEFFFLGWDTPESVAAFEYAPIEIAGIQLFASPDTLRRLMGNELVLDAVDLDPPLGSRKSYKFLKAKGGTRPEREGPIDSNT